MSPLARMLVVAVMPVTVLLVVVIGTGLTAAPVWAQSTDTDPAPDTQAQTQPDPAADADAQSGAVPDAEVPPRVRRLGDVSGENYELQLKAPTAPTENTPLDLQDPEKTARLQRLLSTLAARPGDATALANLDRLLAEVLADVDALMEQRRFEDAQRLLAVVRNVNPRQAGLDEASRELASHQSERYPYTIHGEKYPGGRAPSRSSALNPAQDARIKQLLSALATRPGNAQVLRELDNNLNDLLRQAGDLINRGDFDGAAQLLGVVRNVNPYKTSLAEAEKRLVRARETTGWLAEAERAERRGEIFPPVMNGAWYWYRKVLTIEPENAAALRGLDGMQQRALDQALDAARAYDFAAAETWMAKAAETGGNPEPVTAARQEIENLREQKAQLIENDIMRAIRQQDWNYAEFTLIDLMALGGFEPRVTALRETLQRERVYGAFEPGQVLQDPLSGDLGQAPPVIVIGAGSFLMGSPAVEPDRLDNEGPQHRVTIARAFGLGIQEVTVAQYRIFVEATGYRTEAEVQGSSSVWSDELGRVEERAGVSWRQDYTGAIANDSLPAVHLSWNDAQAYVQWLSRETGLRYRLPAEHEFEFALRAGTTTAYWWGDERPREKVENLAGDADRSAGGHQFGNSLRSYGDGHFGPAPVGLFEANPNGLYDMAGNVAEWVQDCWQGDYSRVGATAAAVEMPDCQRRVVRGGYWASAPRLARSAARVSAVAGMHSSQIGFRVARDL